MSPPWKIDPTVASVCTAAALLLAGCGMLDTERKIEKPPARRVSGAGAVVMVGDDQSGSPVELRTGQQLLVRLRLAGTTRSEWMLLGPEFGALRQVGPARYEQDATSAVYGEVAGTQVWRFEALRPGTAALRFELRVARSLEAPAGAAAFDVTVR